MVFCFGTTKKIPHNDNPMAVRKIKKNYFEKGAMD